MDGAYTMDEEEKIIKILMLRRHRVPGATRKELLKKFGSKYEEILDGARKRVEPLGMEIREVEYKNVKRYFICFKEIREKSNIPRIDDLAILAACITYINAKKEKVKKEEIENLLKEKFSRRRFEFTISRLIRTGYLEEEEGYFSIGWRSLAEVDINQLNKLILS